MENKKIDAVDVLCKFYQLSEEEQKKVIKRLLWQDVIHSYIDKESSLRKEHGVEEFDYFRRNILNRASDVSDSLADVLYGDDERLRDEIVKTFIENYDYTITIAKRRVCGVNHNFTEWNLIGTCFERVCEYCGTKQVAYSENEKQYIEQRTQEEIKFSNFCKKLTKEIINKPNKEN